ncbi:LTA synthase family protein [Jeotgalibacillus proteolyticus]|uniref:LTA synthase family protein n=1 Tax=Jeotgalibacillus proteolyticus TaxID=2082395 RepID=A0A2S5GCX9_9BACL|nr:LTA synthase family protein [Jeotgalibacillus proteolyticus]PPA70753.1 LTA synthase family protein [Jeotgalibacillus proteolyticus]
MEGLRRVLRLYGDYFIYVGLLLLKLYLLSVATGTYFSFRLSVVSLGSIFLLSFWILLISPKVRRWMLVGFTILISFLIISNIWYYRYFTDFLSASLIIQLPQMDAVGGGMQDLIYWSDFLFFLDAVIFLVVLVFLRKQKFQTYTKKRRVVSAAAALTAGLFLFYSPSVLSFSNDQAGSKEEPVSNLSRYYQIGMIGYHAVDLRDEMYENWFEDTTLTEDEKESIDNFFDGKDPEAGEPPEQLPNVIVIQLESFQTSVIDQEIDGQMLTPHLNELKDESAYFPNFYHQTHEGRTSDAEFIINSSLYPLKSGSVYTRYSDHLFDTLPGRLKENGYETAAFHAFRPNFWNRDQVYENFGYDTFYSIEDFPDGDIIGLTLNDKDFFLTGVEKMKELEAPYFAFMVALTSHTPYDFPKDKRVLDLDRFDEEILQNYYHNIHYVDSAFGEMKEKLVEVGMWEDSLIVVYGDHDSALQKQGREMADFEDAESAVDFVQLGRRVPLFIKPPQGQGNNGEVIEKAGGQLDVAPTILSMLGLQSDYMMGASLFSDEENMVVFRDGSAIDDTFYYEASLWDAEGGACYSLETEKKVSSGKCEEISEEAARQLRLSDLVIRKDGIQQLQSER